MDTMPEKKETTLVEDTYRQRQAELAEKEVTEILQKGFQIGQLVPFNKIMFRLVSIDRGCLVLRAETTTEKVKKNREKKG